VRGSREHCGGSGVPPGGDCVTVQGEVFKERKEGVERETVRHNGASTMAENDGEDKGHDVRKSVTGEASRGIDCMQRISLRQILIVGQNHPQSAKPTVVREQKQHWQTW